MNGVAINVSQMVADLGSRGVRLRLVDDTLDADGRLSAVDRELLRRHGPLLREHLLAERRGRLAALGRSESREPDPTHLEFAAWLHAHGRLDG